MRQRPRGRAHIARRRRIVLGFDPVDISEYATARDRPTLWEKRNNAPAEILMIDAFSEKMCAEAEDGEPFNVLTLMEDVRR